MSDETTKAAEDAALKFLALAADLYGAPGVGEIIDIIDGKSTSETIEDMALLVRAVVQGVVDVLDPAGARAALQAGYVAANAVGDAALNAKFGKP